MKILKIFGVVAGIHLFALILIFANPGCSSTTRPPPAPIDTVPQPPASVTLPPPGQSSRASTIEPPIAFNPDAPAVASGSGVRFNPTRPGSPAAGTLMPEPVPDVRPATTYRVVSGDNLWNLAKKHGITVAELASVNGINPNTVLRPGQNLIIPAKSTSPASTAAASPGAVRGEKPRPTAVKQPPPPPPADAVTHLVKSGETLGVIARRYGVKSGDIAVANNIADPQKIFPGMELVIPGWQMPPAKSGKAASKSAPAPAQKSNAPKSAPPRITPTETDATAQRQTPPAEVPVIRIDDSPLSPAPKN